MPFVLCRVRRLCRAPGYGFAVDIFFTVRPVFLYSLPCRHSLSCGFVPSHGKDFFAVRMRIATTRRTTMPFPP
jgi:hypothetical protein